MPHYFRRRGRLGAGAVLLGLLACSHASDHGSLHYEVRLRDGGVVPVSIHYLTASGEERTAKGMTPWMGPEVTFGPGSTSLVQADTPANSSTTNPLLCVLAGSQQEDGEWVEGRVGSGFQRCQTSYDFGQWPPDDNTGSLIRVG